MVASKAIIAKPDRVDQTKVMLLPKSACMQASPTQPKMVKKATNLSFLERRTENQFLYPHQILHQCPNLYPYQLQKR